jgi:RNA polymerase sigma factor (sigma-70 family)
MMTTLTCDVPPSSLPLDTTLSGRPVPSLTLPSAEYAAASDDQLIACARATDDCRALAELIGRYYLWLSAVIRRRARRAGLCREDAEDAQQDTVHALLDAVRDYDLVQCAARRGCSFRTFLGRRAINRFQNALKRLRWLETHRRGEKELVAALEKRSRRSAAVSAGPCWLEPEPIDPAQTAQRRELAVQVRQVFATLSPEQQQLWEATAAGTSREELGQQLGVTRRTVHRRQEALSALLGARLKDLLW